MIRRLDSAPFVLATPGHRAFLPCVESVVERGEQSVPNQWPNAFRPKAVPDELVIVALAPYSGIWTR